MSDEKLVPKLEQVKIKQTSPIRFKDETINKINKEQFIFGIKRDLFIPFIVSKDSHQKGLKLRIYKGRIGSKETKKTFYLQYWFNGKPTDLSLEITNGYSSKKLYKGQDPKDVFKKLMSGEKRN